MVYTGILVSVVVGGAIILAIKNPPCLQNKSSVSREPEN